SSKVTRIIAYAAKRRKYLLMKNKNTNTPTKINGIIIFLLLISRCVVQSPVENIFGATKVKMKENNTILPTQIKEIAKLLFSFFCKKYSSPKAANILAQN